MRKAFSWLGYGLITWIVPFVVSFGFYDQNGNLQTSYDLFKSTMIVVSSLAGGYVLFLFFRNIKEDYVRWAFVFGLFLLLFNWVLDFLILMPFAKMEYGFYFESIGLRYLQIPVFSITIGLILRMKQQ